MLRSEYLIADNIQNTDYIHEISNDAGRSMMGSRQENWFYNELGTSAKRGATWRLIGSQTGKYYHNASSRTMLTSLSLLSYQRVSRLR